MFVHQGHSAAEDTIQQVSARAREWMQGVGGWWLAVHRRSFPLYVSVRVHSVRGAPSLA